MSGYYWLFQYSDQALFYFINELKLNNGLSLDSYKSMNKGDLVRHVLADSQGLEKTARYIDTFKIFQNDKYLDCWQAAFPEDGNICGKITYGICAYDKYGKGSNIAFANNRPVGAAVCNTPAYCSDCVDADKVRIGFDGCDYAVSWLLAKLFKLGYQPDNLEEIAIYEAGFSIQQGFKPIFNSDDVYFPHSLRIFSPFNFKKIWEVVQKNGQVVWHELSFEKEFLQTAKR